MSRQVLFYSGILLMGVLISSISQVMLKKASMRAYASPLREYLNPLVISAYALFFGTTILSILAYRVLPLSFGPVLESTSYLYITFFGAVIFKEKITKKKIAALLCIISGIIISVCGG